MPKVVAKMIEVDAMNAPAIAKADWQRAASHSKNGSTKAPGLNDSHEPVFCVMVNEQATAVRPSTTTPSIHCSRDGGLRHIWAIATTSGATTIIPTQPERNHSRQTSPNGAMVSA